MGHFCSVSLWFTLMCPTMKMIRNTAAISSSTGQYAARWAILNITEKEKNIMLNIPVRATFNLLHGGLDNDYWHFFETGGCVAFKVWLGKNEHEYYVLWIWRTAKNIFTKPGCFQQTKFLLLPWFSLEINCPCLVNMLEGSDGEMLEANKLRCLQSEARLLGVSVVPVNTPAS